MEGEDVRLASKFLGFLCLLFAPCGLWLEGHAANPNTGLDKIKYEDWHDVKRSRDLPVKWYLPSDLSAPRPVAIFSHGLGGSREAAQYLGTYWAEHGFICVFIQHPGSDVSFWKPTITPGSRPDRKQLLGKFRNQLKNPMHAVNRAQDVHFVIDQLEKINQNDPLLRGKLKMDAIAIAGHSYGAWTSLTASGQRMVGPAGRSVENGDPRIKCAIYLSPTSPRKGQDPSIVFGGIKIPGLHLTGTLDDSPVNDGTAGDRRIAFDNISKSDQYLVILNGANHATFGGRPEIRSQDKLHHGIIQEVTTAFLNAYLKNDPKAKQWLLKSAGNYIKPYGTYELKVVAN